MKCTQSGLSEVANNLIFWGLLEGQGPIMLVMPSDVKGRNYAKKRITPMIKNCPQLREKQVLEKNKTDSITEKIFINATLSITGAQTSTGLKADPIRLLIQDEITSYPLDVDQEGDPVELAYQRTKSYQGKRKIFYLSTPGLLRSCRIYKKYLESDQRKLFVPCPHCQTYQVLRWDRMKFTESNPADAKYQCLHCKELIDHSYKTWMIQRHEWRKTFPDRKIAGFQLSALYSPVGIGDDWGTLAKRFIEAGKDTIKLKSFYNNELGIPWDDYDEGIEWKDIYMRPPAFRYQSGTVHNDARLLTMGVDIQKGYIAYEIVAWKPDRTSYSVQYDEIEGDTKDDDVWEKLLKVINGRYYDSRGIDWSIARVGIDTGYRVDRVYTFLRSLDGINRDRVLAVDGRSSSSMNQYIGTPSIIDVDIAGKKVRQGLKIHPVGTSIIKSELFAMLKLQPTAEGVYPKGYCHFPEDYSERYYQMLTAEQLQVVRTKTGERWDWVKIRRRNEAIDCRVYARSLSYLYGLDTLPASYWAAIDRKIEAYISKQQRKGQL